jgi:hypothetical protein
VNGPAPHRSAKDCALCLAHLTAAERHKTAPPARRRRVIPWIAAFFLSGAVVPFIGESGPWVALGLWTGLATGALLAWRNERTNLHYAAATLDEATRELQAEADQRVTMVIRQFEWAVNDVANLRNALKQAHDEKALVEADRETAAARLRELERQVFEDQARISEPEASVVPLRWQLSDENMLTWIRFKSVDVVPSQIRILNEKGSVVAIGARSRAAVNIRDESALVVRAPDDVIAMLAGLGADSYRFEALVGETWRRVELRRPFGGGDTWDPEPDHRAQELIA